MLRIFQTKKAEYNKLILKSLVFGPKSTSQIAEYIYLNRKAQIKPKKINKNEVKKIISIISRKGSRLDELASKDYITRKDGTWHLTSKGLSVGLTLFDSVEEFLPYVILDLDLSNLTKKLHGIPFLEAFISGETLNKMLNPRASKKWILAIRECTNELIKQGLDLDNMSEKEFQIVLSAKLVSYFTNVELLDKFERELSHE